MHHRFTAFTASVALCFALTASAADVATPRDCRALTWMECATFVRSVLNGTTDSRAVIAIGVVWSDKFAESYKRIQDLGRAPTETDTDRLIAELEQKVDPVSWASDQAIDAAIRQYVPRLAPLIAMVESAPFAALSAFFWPSRIASDDAALRDTNQEIQEAIFVVLDKSGKRDRYRSFVGELRTQIGPKP